MTERVATQVLARILAIVQRYLPPDGMPIKDAMSEIISCVDPWPLTSVAAEGAKPAVQGDPCTVCNALIVARNATHHDPQDLAAAEVRGKINAARLAAQVQPAEQVGKWDLLDEQIRLQIVAHYSAKGEPIEADDVTVDDIAFVRMVLEAFPPTLATPAPQPSEPDMRAVCEALGFDPTNHHNAAKCPYCRPALQQPVSAGPVATRVCREVAELPDRNSPEDQPEMMLVTHGELFSIVCGVLGSALSTPAQQAEQGK